ncbi:MAG: LacI family transcriptional regulator [Gaiellales bacterium]|jgi:LacI family transcriptional regulator|nr:LacI family transcriptional regulator [Gaiellales bacterium]
MTVTLKDVARAAGVSQATAARALGGYGYASPNARGRVQESARRLGYTPNAVARALVSNATLTVGLIVGDIENPFFAAVARGLSDVLEAAGYTVLLANADEDSERERRALRALRSRRVDGLAVVPAPGARLEGVVESGVALVQLDRAVRGLAADAVLVDNAAGASAAVSHLIRLGHRRVGIVSDSPQISSTAERISGYRRALRAAGIELDAALISIGGSHQSEAPRAALALLERRDRPTAVFTANNFMTHGVLQAARQLGLRIPTDLALVGFDDFDWTTLVDPPLTVVAQPAGELGRVAGERLLARIHGDTSPPRRLRLRTRLIVRGSCGAMA